ncbi:protein kinase domain-containing protein [Intrasporangium sp.]|uniref:protein kinase domain-containing protein n=1 Tax=Intrasporangium sp. TaxID=1925024 RepID=UPI00293B7335|nr:protein kinase [Intrasporangium sp.]MDV3223355.1 protein kinase [Intrasporangium sp.]
MAAHDRTRWVPAPATGPRRAGPNRPADIERPRHERIGTYRLVEEIGEGGMGVVHLALDPRGRAVAIKVLRAHVASDDEARMRLRREVDTLSRIRDHRVASVIDADVTAPRPYIVTRYVPGPALDDWVEEHGALDPDALLRLACGTAEAIRAIHASGVVHRDIKPGNVLLEDGEPVLIDFGIAHIQDDVRHTMGGLVMGTPGYLSPELVEGAPITDATDWWGWAATITFAASGRPPFGRGRMDVVLAKVRAGEVDLDGVDPRLVPLLRASLAPDPAGRPHADDVIKALSRFAAGRAATVPNPRGGTWDDPAHNGKAPTGPTEVFQPRSTAVLPPALHSSGPAAPPVVEAPSRRTPPRAWRAPHTEASPAAYGHGDEVEEWEEDYDDGWDEPDQPEREGDPRIGLARRTGTLLAAAVAWLGALALWPGIAVAAVVGWSVVARGVDRSMTGLVLRRYDRGRRPSDVPWAVVTSPWHVLVGAVATAVAMLLPAAVAVAGVFSAALLLSGATGSDLDPGTPLTLVVGGGLAVAVMWWGPGGASLRRGSRSIVRRLVPMGLAAQVVAGVLAAGGVVLALVALKGGTSTWVPFDGNPFGP